MDKEEYMKFIVPDEYDRRAALFRRGIESAKQNSGKKRAMIERMAFKKRRKEVADKYDI